MKKFRNRLEAGQQLATALKTYTSRSDVLVLALPRGGVPVGFEISKALNLPLDVFLVRKLGTPHQEELALGAIAMGGIHVLNESLVQSLGISDSTIKAIALKEEKELQRRNDVYRGGRAFPEVKNKIVILVDDGLATGATMRAAVTALKQSHPAKIIVAVPVSPEDTYLEFKNLVDEVVCLKIPEPFYSLSLWYDEFTQTSDDEVCALLTKKPSSD